MIRVLVAEDQHMIRGALVALLALETDIDVVAEVERGDLIVSTAQQTRPDVALIDIDLPGLDGIQAAAELHRSLPGCGTLMLTGLTQPGHLLRAMTAHVRGFMLKSAPPERLADAIRRVARGDRVFDPDLVAAAIETGVSPLTPREAEVLRAAERGLPSDEIAALLYLSPATVRNYLSSAIAKTGTRNRVEASRIAREAGWLTSGGSESSS
jgi:two-component system response regulator DesR